MLRATLFVLAVVAVAAERELEGRSCAGEGAMGRRRAPTLTPAPSPSPAKTFKTYGAALADAGGDFVFPVRKNVPEQGAFGAVDLR